MRMGWTIALLLVLLTGCYKDTVDVADLRDNPFDPDYQGEPVFVLEGTFLQQVDIGTGSVVYQIIEIRVREDLFLAPATYSVAARDLQTGQEELLNPDPPGGALFRFQRAPSPGQPVCLELRLSNNQSTARAETLCATL